MKDDRQNRSVKKSHRLTKINKRHFGSHLRKLLIMAVIVSNLLFSFKVPGMYDICCVKAADIGMTVEMDVEIALTYDKDKNAFTGSGELKEYSTDAHLHRLISVSLPETFEINTPVGIRDAPEGTVVVYDGLMSARRGYANNAGEDHSSTLSVFIPLTEEFSEYGAGEYSLIIPVEFIVKKAYGSYTDKYEFCLWDDLISQGMINVSGSSLVSASFSTDVLEIDPSISSIQSQCFMSGAFREVDVPESVTSASHAFAYSPVREIYFEGATVPERVCTNAQSLEKVVLAEGVTTFGEEVFLGCTALSDFEFPSTLTTLGIRAFDGCSGLSEFVIKTDLTVKAKTTAGSPLKGSGISRITVEDGVTQIPARLYCDASALSEVILPVSVTKIGSNAFSGASGVTVYYAGTAAQWSKVKLNGFSPAQVICQAGLDTLALSIRAVESPLASMQETEFEAISDDADAKDYVDENWEGDDVEDFIDENQEDIETLTDEDAITPVDVESITDECNYVDEKIEDEESEDEDEHITYNTGNIGE